jgi:hypothetical protein
MILFEKYGAHQPLNRQSERYAREGVGLELSTIGPAARSPGGMSAKPTGPTMSAPARPCWRRSTS